MKANRKQLVALLLVLSVACATVGTGDPVVVRAEDVLTNSLSVYTAAMNFHFANSTKEKPATYHVFEDFRVKFPIAWNALDAAKRAYQLDKTKGTSSIDAALAALTGLVSAITPLIGVTP